MEAWKNHWRREYGVPCLIMLVIHILCLIVYDSPYLIQYHDIIEIIGKVSFSVTMFFLLLFVNLGYLMND